MTNKFKAGEASGPGSSNPFKNSMGVRYLQGLFYETTLKDKTSVVYTLKDQDHEGFPSLYRLFMETGDPTEWRFATAHLDGWEHWEMLCKCSWFKDIADRWRRELELQLRSQALASVLEVAKDKKNQNSYYANKYLLDGSWKPAGASRAGRPTKEAIKREAAQIVSEAQQIDQDFTRVLQN